MYSHDLSFLFYVSHVCLTKINKKTYGEKGYFIYKLDYAFYNSFEMISKLDYAFSNILEMISTLECHAARKCNEFIIYELSCN